MKKAFFGSTEPLSTNTVGKANVVGTRFENISNPYSNMPRTQTPWDRFLNALGFRSGYDKAQEQYNLAGAEYNAQLEQLASEEAYNSPAQQAARMRQAGLNPDLTGINGEPASEFDNQQQSPDISASAVDFDQVRSFADGVMNIFTTALGLTSSVQGLVRNKIQNSILRTQDESTFKDFAESMFPYFISETPGVDESGANPLGRALSLASIFAQNNLPYRMQKKFVNEAYQFFHSAPGDSRSYEEWSKRVSSRKNYYNNSLSFYSESDQVLQIITEGLTSVQEELTRKNLELQRSGQEVTEASQQASIAESKNQEAYFNSLDSSLQAQSENSANEFNKTNLDMNKILNESLGSMIDKLDKASKHDGIKGGLASIAMALLASFRLYITTQGMPSYSRSTTSGPKGTTVSSSFSN